MIIQFQISKPWRTMNAAESLQNGVASMGGIASRNYQNEDE